MKIEELDFTVRTYNCLKRARIDTVEQLKLLSESDLSRIRGLGVKCAGEIRKKIGMIPPSKADCIRAMTDIELATLIREEQCNAVLQQRIESLPNILARLKQQVEQG